MAIPPLSVTLTVSGVSFTLTPSSPFSRISLRERSAATGGSKLRSGSSRDGDGDGDGDGTAQHTHGECTAPPAASDAARSSPERTKKRQRPGTRRHKVLVLLLQPSDRTFELVEIPPPSRARSATVTVGEILNDLIPAKARNARLGRQVHAGLYRYRLPSVNGADGDGGFVGGLLADPSAALAVPAHRGEILVAVPKDTAACSRDACRSAADMLVRDLVARGVVTPTGTLVEDHNDDDEAEAGHCSKMKNDRRRDGGDGGDGVGPLGGEDDGVAPTAEKRDDGAVVIADLVNFTGELVITSSMLERRGCKGACPACRGAGAASPSESLRTNGVSGRRLLENNTVDGLPPSVVTERSHLDWSQSDPSLLRDPSAGGEHRRDSGGKKPSGILRSGPESRFGSSLLSSSTTTRSETNRWNRAGVSFVGAHNGYDNDHSVPIDNGSTEHLGSRYGIFETEPTSSSTRSTACGSSVRTVSFQEAEGGSKRGSSSSDHPLADDAGKSDSPSSSKLGQRQKLAMSWGTLVGRAVSESASASADEKVGLSAPPQEARLFGGSSEQRLGGGVKSELRRKGIKADTDSERALTFLSDEQHRVRSAASTILGVAPSLHRQDGAEEEIEKGHALPSVASALTLGLSSSSRLHMACARPDVTAADLRRTLRENPSAASMRDPFGRYPLHVLAENDSLAASMPIEEGARVLRALLDANPQAILARDIEDELPFVNAVAEWIVGVYADSFDAEMRSIDASSERRDSASLPSASLSHSLYAFPEDIVVPRHVVWCLRMLSVAIDHLAPEMNMSRWQRRVAAETRATLAGHIASIPYLCKTLLLVASEEERGMIFNMSIIRPVVLYPDVVGYWLVVMIRANNSRAVEFLGRLSNVTVADWVGRERGFSKEEVRTFVDRRKDVFDVVASLSGLIPSMLALSVHKIEEAASTRVIAYVLDGAIKNPISLGFMLFELVLEVIMVITYRIYVDGENAVAGVVNGCGALSMLISSYFLLREALTAMAMIGASGVRERKSYVRDFWTINDVLSMVMTLTSCLLKESGVSVPTLFAFTIGFLWLKILGTLKTLNRHLATFILALVEIVKEIRWFLLILGLAIIMFADMIEIISKNSGLCQADGNEFEEGRRRLSAQDDFCSPYSLDGYARIYAILIGDVSLEDFQQQRVITVLFVLFTFFGVLILMSVLIAIVEDAYSRAKIRSFALFGRARTEHVAREQIRERFLRLEEDKPERPCSLKGFKRISKRLVRWSVTFVTVGVAVAVMTLLITTIHAVFFEYTVYGNIRNLDLVLVALAVVFAASLLALIALHVNANHARKFGSVLRTFLAVAILPVSCFCRFLGIDKNDGKALDAVSTSNDSDEWVSKIHYMEQRTLSIVGKSEDRVLLTVNKCIKESEERVIEKSRRNLVEAEEDMNRGRNILFPTPGANEGEA